MRQTRAEADRGAQAPGRCRGIRATEKQAPAVPHRGPLRPWPDFEGFPGLSYDFTRTLLEFYQETRTSYDFLGRPGAS